MTLKSPSRSSRLHRAARASLGGIGLFALLAGTSAGCLDRPVAPAQPSTTNIFVDPLIQQVVDKIDLLFMIDNSRSMQDKQRILEQAVPQLLSRLITPYCIDAAGNVTNPNGAPCPSGTEPEFSPVDDIHIGIVTSSLGGHGADLCSPKDREGWNPSQDDKAQLLPSVPRTDPMGNPVTLPQTGNTGFLAWDPGGTKGGETDRERLISNFTRQVANAGETGCGFEASLEAWYRFLIDPDPPVEVVEKNGSAEAVRPNQTVLTQRREFLRPDSLVAVVMLTDENDCSTVDGGVGWLAATGTLNGGEYHLPKATAVCAKNPNDVCCRSCASTENAPPAGCQPLAADPGCADPVFHDANTDPLNLRCWDQQRRFGVNFLYGVERYIRGLTELTVQNHKNEQVPNPLFQNLSGGPSRKQSLVFLAGIVGVPWQDIATEETLNKPNDLKYLSASALAQKERWKMILGDPKKGILPTDALMIESVQDRTTLPGVNPAHPLMLGNLAPAPGQGQRGGNPINGNEYAPKMRDDLQYACVFPLATPRDCAGVPYCDCENEQGTGKPLCNGTQQDFAKAYPGIRHLEVLKGVSETTLQKDNAIVASICPKITDRENPARDNPAYGYNPAVASILDALKVQLRGKCLPRKLDVDKRTKQVPCVVIEALPSVNGACNACDPNKARGDLTGKEALIPPVHARLAEMEQCGGNAGRSCEDFCLCEILPTQPGPAEEACLTNPRASNSGNQYGYCYVDPENKRGSDDVVRTCPASAKRKIQFIGEDTPANGSVAFVACVGGNVTDQNDTDQGDGGP